MSWTCAGKGALPLERIEKSVLDELVMTDTIAPSDAAKKSKAIRILPIAPLLGEAIRRIANEESVSKLFDR